jgi:hypothetical protein
LKSLLPSKNVSGILTHVGLGGTGLNLTVANHVFLLDPWWYVDSSLFRLPP